MEPVLLCFVLCLMFPGASSPGVSVRTMTVRVGEDIVLKCSTAERIDDNKGVTVEWTRKDLKDSYLLLFRDGRYDHTQQDPSFKDRVELADRELTNGDLSIFLLNAQLRDSGDYQCYFYKDSSRKKRATEELLTTITVKVEGVELIRSHQNKEESPPESGTGPGGEQTETAEGTSLGLTVGVVLSVFAAVLFVCVFLKFRAHQKSQGAD